MILLPTIQIGPTKSDFNGDITIVVFPFVKVLRKKPEEIGQIIGQHLVEGIEHILNFETVKGFLNLTFSKVYWNEYLANHFRDSHFGKQSQQGEKSSCRVFISQHQQTSSFRSHSKYSNWMVNQPNLRGSRIRCSENSDYQ